MKKYKVLHVIGTLQIGGAENIAVGFYRNIDGSVFEMDYLVYNEKESFYVDEVIRLGGKVIRQPNILKSRFNIEKELEKIMCENGPYDAVHSHLMHHNGYVVSAAKKVGIRKRISHAHSTSDGKKKSFLRYIYKKIMHRKIIKNATDLVACGKEAGIYLYGKEDFFKKAYIINNRIDAEKFRYTKEKNISLREKFEFEENKIFLIIGHLISLKNHKFIFNIFEKILEDLPESKLLVLGNGELKEELVEWVVDRGLSENIEFKGNVSNVNEYLIASDYFFMPSIYEGLPVTLIEAQASGIKCFISDKITKEAIIVDNVSVCDINNGINIWVEEIKKSIVYERIDNIEKIRNKNYDVTGYGDWLKEFYLKKSNKEGI